jgi:Spy/CpxP family protein refolding chaperone
MTTRETRSVLRHALAVIALTASAGWGMTAMAAPGEATQSGMHSHRALHADMHAQPGLMPLGGRGLQKMLDTVGASDEQRAQAAQIAAATRADMAANRVAGQALREQVSELFVQPEVDAVAAEALRQQMLAQHDRRSQRMMQAMLELSQVLTPEQRQQWVTTMQTQRSAMQNHANRRGQGADRVPGRLHRHGVDGTPPGAQSGAASS